MVKNLVEQLFEQAFPVGGTRDPRSAPYKEGVRAVLAFRIDGTKIPLPYRLGTAEADAHFAGCDEGHMLWRKAVDEGVIAKVG